MSGVLPCRLGRCLVFELLFLALLLAHRRPKEDGRASANEWEVYGAFAVLTAVMKFSEVESTDCCPCLFFDLDDSVIAVPGRRSEDEELGILRKVDKGVGIRARRDGFKEEKERAIGVLVLLLLRLDVMLTPLGVDVVLPCIHFRSRERHTLREGDRRRKKSSCPSSRLNSWSWMPIVIGCR